MSAELAMHVAILALEGYFDTGLSVYVDAFGTANEIARSEGLPPPFELSVLGVEGEVRSHAGARLPAAPLDREVGSPGAGPGTDVPIPDLVLVPALVARSEGEVLAALGRQDCRAAIEALRRFSAAGSRVGAACVGTFVLAEAGLLEGRRATTTWWLADFFEARYPGTRLEREAMVVDSGPVVTAGAALGHMDLALRVIRGESPRLADLVAARLVVDSRPSQSAYAIGGHLRADARLLETFESWCLDRLGSAFSLEAAAAACAASPRSLSRKARAGLGLSPLGFFNELRARRARHLLATTKASAESVAEELGYGDAASLRRLLRKRYGAGLRELRGGPARGRAGGPDRAP